jgi:hypothetical protein
LTLIVPTPPSAQTPSRKELLNKALASLKKKRLGKASSPPKVTPLGAILDSDSVEEDNASDSEFDSDDIVELDLGEGNVREAADDSFIVDDAEDNEAVAEAMASMRFKNRNPKEHFLVLIHYMVTLRANPNILKDDSLKDIDSMSINSNIIP